ncbi:hypothetical protein [Longitalea luteola]|uniref:hypothetical protein n=1 Tax=Longitalea luteola TaxID=2812563 RepID=UPI001A97BC26|nr:hypothetical protein [Longitalea luteola]
MTKPAIRSAIAQDADDKRSIRWIILIPFIIVLGVLAAIVRQGETTNSKQRLEAVKPAQHGALAGSDASIKKMVRNNIWLYVKAESNDYDKKGLGGISNLEISVTNPTDYTLDKVRVKIMYVKANGSIFETKYEDFFSVKPNSKATHKISDTKRGTSVKYEISSIRSKALGLS